MSRTYTDTPEPRYVEKAKESETTSMLPEIKNADRGKYLKVKANKNELMYDSIPNEVPVPTIADAGKVLGVDENGDYAIVEESGGDPGYNVEEETLFDEDVNWQEEGGEE